LTATIAVFTGLLMIVAVVPAGGATPGTATSGPRTSHAAANKAKGDKPKGHKPKGADGVTDQIQKLVLKFAADKLAGFALSQVGLGSLLADPTDTKLNQLQDQISEISIQQAKLEDGLNTVAKDISKILLDQYELQFRHIATQIDVLYTLFYLPALNALTNYIREYKKAGDQCVADPCLTYKNAYFGVPGDPSKPGLKQEFLNQFTTAGAASYGEDLHNLIMPGPTGSSIMTAYGSFLAKSGTGTLTSVDSAKVLNYYNYWADYRALAMWMLGQWAAATDPDTRFATVTAQISSFDKTEHDALPPPIPTDTIIYLGPDAATRTNNTTHMLMWRAPSDPLTATPSWIPYDPITPGGAVALDLRVMNSGGDIKDWRVPTRAELDSLLKMGPTTKSAADFLLSINPDWPHQFALSLDRVNEPYIWTDQPAGVPAWKGSPAIACVNNGVTVASLTGYLHTAVGPLANSLRGFPSQFQNYSRPDPGQTKISVNLAPGSTQQQMIEACQAVLKADVLQRWDANPDGFFATLLATRNTGDVSYLPYKAGT
jgi:hypothetical protein